MEIRVLKNDDDIFILEPHGCMDLYSSTQIKEMAMKLIERKIEGIIIDLKFVDSIKSAGIGALINISSTLKKLNYAMAITNVGAEVRKIMEITRLTGYLPIIPTLKESVDQINAAR